MLFKDAIISARSAIINAQISKDAPDNPLDNRLEDILTILDDIIKEEEDV